MFTYIYVYIYIMYINICTHVCICIHIYMCIYTYLQAHFNRTLATASCPCAAAKKRGVHEHPATLPPLPISSAAAFTYAHQCTSNR